MARPSTDPWAPVIDAAMMIFAVDPDYACAMARATRNLTSYAASRRPGYTPKPAARRPEYPSRTRRRVAAVMRATTPGTYIATGAITHGATAYRIHQCRCQTCRADYAARLRAWRAAARLRRDQGASITIESIRIERCWTVLLGAQDLRYVP